MALWPKTLAVGMLAGVLASAQSEPAAVEQARMLVRSGQFSEAEKVLEEAISAGQQPAVVYGELGMLYYGHGRYEDAVRNLGRAAQLEPESAKYSIALAEALIGWGRFPVAAEFLLAVKSNFELLPEYHYNLGLAYYGIHNFPMALAEFETTIRLAPKLDQAYFFIGNCRAAMGNLQAAMEQYRKALELSPRNAAYCVALGKILSQLGSEHQKEAIQWLKKSLAIKPDDVPGKFYLALAYEKTGQLNAARELLEEIAARRPDEAEPHVALARIYYRLKQPEKGARESRVVRKLQSKGQ